MEGYIMKRFVTAAAIAVPALLLACGGGEDKTAAQPPESAAKAPATQAAAPKASAAPQAASPAAPEPAAAAPAEEDAKTRCLALAAQMKWSEALDPCTQAAKAHPTDLRIKHAVQQAQAAAEG